jgi:hypothetical protein
MHAGLAADPALEITEMVVEEAGRLLLALVETDQAACTADVLTAHAVETLVQVG